MEVPREPVIFLKAPSSLCRANDDLVIPRGSEKTDWEVELAVVLSKRCRYVSEPEAMRCLAGYCMHNDYSERTFQFERGGQWVTAESCDTFGPLGPFLATRDEIKDADHLHLWLK